MVECERERQPGDAPAGRRSEQQPSPVMEQALATRQRPEVEGCSVPCYGRSEPDERCGIVKPGGIGVARVEVRIVQAFATPTARRPRRRRRAPSRRDSRGCGEDTPRRGLEDRGSRCRGRLRSGSLHRSRASLRRPAERSASRSAYSCPSCIVAASIVKNRLIGSALGAIRRIRTTALRLGRRLSWVWRADHRSGGEDRGR